MEDTGVGAMIGRAVMGVGASGVARAGEMGEAVAGVVGAGRGGMVALVVVRAGETNGGLIVAEALEEAFTVGLFCAWMGITGSAFDGHFSVGWLGNWCKCKMRERALTIPGLFSFFSSGMGSQLDAWNLSF